MGATSGHIGTAIPWAVAARNTVTFDGSGDIEVAISEEVSNGSAVTVEKNNGIQSLYP